MDHALSESMSFGAVEIRPAQRLVLVDGQPAPLGARAIDVLMALLAHRDRVLTKQELLDLAWPGMVVEENNLQVQISSLRRLLGPQLIATVPGRGYRFTGAPSPTAPPASADVELAAPPATGNLPASLPRLVGRDDEIEGLVQHVRAHRVTTVVGPGGIGKTQLALAAAHPLRAAFGHGVWLVDLAALTDPALVATTVAQVLSLSLPAGANPDESLARQLRGRELLFVMDNCEHVLQAVGSLVQALMNHTAMVRVLATSQERLRLVDERVWRIAPLAIPVQATLEEAASASAVRLFVQRVQAQLGDFALQQDNVAAIVDICRQLDGLPLAVELAAARVPLLGVAGVRERLADRFRVLTAGWRTASPRHQTLREMLEWSCGLLSDAERALFFRAGIFAGSFSVETAQQVLADGGLEPWEVLDLLGSLVEKSLVVSDGTGPTRLRLLETMRAYALERLRESPATLAVLARRHAQAIAGLLADGAAQAWVVPSQVRLARVLPDLDNVRAALAWAARAPDAADVQVALAAASSWVWLLANLRVEGLAHLDAALQRLPDAPDGVAQARLLAGWASLRFPMAGAQEIAAVARAEALFLEAGDRRGAYEAGWTRVRTAAALLDAPGCEKACDEMAALLDPAWPAIARWQLLTARFFAGFFIGGAAAATMEADTLESLRLSEAFGDLRLRAHSLMYLEQATERAGRFDEAVQRGEQLLTLLRDVPFTLLRPMAMHNLCVSLTHLGRLDEALAAGRDSLLEHRLAGTTSMVLDGAAWLAARRGRLEQAARALGRADAAAAAGHAARQPNEHVVRSLTLDVLQRALAAPELDRLLQAGAALSDEDAASQALEMMHA